MDGTSLGASIGSRAAPLQVKLCSEASARPDLSLGIESLVWIPPIGSSEHWFHAFPDP